MNKFYHKIPFLFLCLFLCLTVTFSSCDTIKTYSHKALNLVGLGSDKVAEKKSTKNSKQDKKNNKAKKDKTENKKTALKDKKDNKRIVLTKEDNKPPIKADKNKKDNNTINLLEDNSLPLNIQKKIGGIAKNILADKDYIYLDFGGSFVIFDHHFNQLARHQLDQPIVSIKRIKVENKTRLLLKEENNSLEIFDLIQSDDNTYLEAIKAFDIEGDFSWVDDNTMLIFLPDKIQLLNFTDLKNITLITEIPIGGITSAFTINKHIFLARENFVDILSLETNDIISSVRVGHLFEFLTLIDNNNQPTLMLALLTPTKAIKGIQYLQLNKAKTGITGLGDKIVLPTPLVNYSYSHTKSLIIGKEAQSTFYTPTQLFSIKHKKNLRGSIATETKLVAWEFFEDKLYLIEASGLSINNVKLDEKVIAQADSINKILTDNSGNAPLAKIGANKLVKDEYILEETGSLEYTADARKVVLLDKKHFVMIEKRASEPIDNILATTSFMEKSFELKTPKQARLSTFQDLLTTDFGLLMYSQKNKTISILDIDLTNITTLPIKIDDLINWTQFPLPDKNILALATTQTKGYAVNFYDLIDEQNTPLIASIAYPSKPFVFYIPEKQIVVLTKDKLDLYSYDDIINTEEKTEPSPLETVKLDLIKKDIILAKISPSFDKIYTLLKSNKRYKILVFDLFNLDKNAYLKDFDILPSHFKGSSFSMNGRLFILPTTEGTLFYDMTSLRSIKEVAHWPIPSYYVDIAMQGQFMCVALGYKGIYCGELNF